MQDELQYLKVISNKLQSVRQTEDGTVTVDWNELDNELHNVLRKQLYYLCRDAGVPFEQARVTEIVKTDEPGVSMILGDGHKLLGKKLRSLLCIERRTHEQSPVVAVNVSIPIEVLEKDNELRSMCKTDQLTIWMGNGTSLPGLFDLQLPIHRVFQQDNFVCHNGLLVLVGDAAHSVLINGSHNTSMAIGPPVYQI
ncbi:hypothetical protein R3P38DRAFT_2770971 [Favolaschia claudopus]|uniref:Uncharacterized protein n=1 Tax=Favolaschia claudopus TaxID=2862362 RepID=A0AAW0CCS3_9AGAR